MRFLTCLPLLLLPLTGLAASSRPNVVIILADDMGYGDPRCYNPQSKIPTPNIDRLARDGLRFTDAHAAGSLCHPSRYGLMTGQYPFRTDVSLWPTQPLIGAGQMTVASLLRSGGYRTAMVGKWHLGFQESGYDRALPGGPVDHGFDSFFGFRASTDIAPYFYIRNNHAVVPPTDTIADGKDHPGLGFSPLQGKYWRGGGISPGLKLADVLPRLTDEAVAVITDHARTPSAAPLFLYFALTGPHTPWFPAEEFQGRSGAGTYGDFSMMVDAMIGRVLRALDEAKMTENTLVLFASDNGPVWYPEDRTRTGHDSAGGFRGMKASNWEAGHREPFIVRWPGHVAPGTHSDQLVSFVDVMATLADIVQTPLPDAAGLDSRSFLPVLLGRQPADRPVRTQLVVDDSLRSGPWKWIEGHEPMLFQRPNGPTDPARDAPPGLLYNLVDDPRETTNLAAAHPDVALRLKAELAALRKSPRTR